MTLRFVWIAALCAAAALGEGTTPKPKPDEYHAHADTAEATVAADYMVHSFGTDGRTFVVEGYLTVEVALYPKSGRELKVNAGRFTLRVNGRKQALVPMAPVRVAAALKYDDMDRGYSSLGRPLPIPQQGSDRPEAPTAIETVQNAALPEGPARRPVGGFLYFASKDKAGKVKSVELLFDDVVLKLK